MHIVADQFNVKVDTLTAETRFVEDLHESLEFTETVMACEEAFGIAIPDEETVWPPAPKMLESRNGYL